MGIDTEQSLRQQLIFFNVLLLILALFTSRALLSLSTGSFVALTLVSAPFPLTLRRFLRTPLLPGIAALFLTTLLSGLWSTDGQQWMKWTLIKLPLFFLPLAFAAPWQLSTRQWR